MATPARAWGTLFGMGAIRKSLAVIAAVAVLAITAMPTTAAQPTPGTTELFESGEAIAIDIDSSGFPVLLAGEWTYDESVDDYVMTTYLVQCAAVDCSGEPVITQMPSELYDNQRGAMLLDPSDRPLIATFDTSTGILELFDCDDPSCGAWRLLPLDLGVEPGPDGPSARERFEKSVVGFESTADGGLQIMVNLTDSDKAVHVACADVPCFDAQITEIEGPVTSMTLDPEGLPAYTVGTQLVRCGDPACDVTSIGELPGPAVGVTFGESGFPLVLAAKYTQIGDEWPTEHYGLLMHCDDPVCFDEEQHAHRVVRASKETSHRHSNAPLSVHIGPYGLPVVGRYFSPGFDGDSESNEIYQFHAECVAVQCVSTRNGIADKFRMRRSYTDIPTHFVTTPDNTPVVFSAGESPYDYPNHLSVAVSACVPGASCFADEDGNGRPDWIEAPALCREFPVTVDLAAGDLPTAGHDVILGTSSSDVIAAGAGDDVVCGGGGDDVVWGQGGDDVIYGDDGDDKLRGGDGDDLLFGGAGRDDLNGGRDNDEVWGQDGDDVAVRGGTGDDMVNGGTGDDPIVAGNGGSDVVHGAGGSDKVTGGPRPDVVRGGDGSDIVKGNGGVDTVYGDSGDDELYGGPGGDTLVGGAGGDDCNGGVGDDSTTSCESLLNIP